MPGNFFFHGCQNDDVYRVWMFNTLETLKVKLPLMILTPNFIYNFYQSSMHVFDLN